MSSIYEFVKEQRNDYRSLLIEITEGYEYSQYQTLRLIELYHNSKFETGNKDSLGREKPFYNITKFRTNVATRATDLDTKNITIFSDAADAETEAFLLTLKNRNWMKQSNLATFLNRMGHTRAKYGGVLVKKTEQGGELGLHIMQWLNMITDQVDIADGVKIERHYYTPSKLRQVAQQLGWKNIQGAIDAAQKTREAQAGKSPGKQNKTPGAYIEVYEVHGVLPTCMLAGTSDKYPADYGDEHEYERQMHVVVLDESDKEQTNGATLYAGLEDEDPYKYLPYEEVDGRGLGVGVVEDLFEAQVWTNYDVKGKKDLVDLAGKLIYQTTSSSVVAKNILTDLENGSIIDVGPSGSLTAVNTNQAGLGQIAALMSDWNEQAQNVTSTYPAILGQTAQHGTSFRLQAGLVNEASALFEYRRQEAGLFIREIYRDWVLPFLVKQMQSAKDIVADLDPDELQMVSKAAAEHEALQFAKKQALTGSGALVHEQDIEAIKAATHSMHMKSSRKGINKFSGMFDNWAGTIDVDTTGEQRDKKDMLSTLFQLFGAVAANPQLLQDQTMARLFNEIVETAGVSPTLQTSGEQPEQGAQPAPTPSGQTAAPAQPAAPTPITATTIPNVQTR